jgi:predicted DNA-binding transcriptional regulator AlpA
VRAPLTKPSTLDVIGLSQVASLCGTTSRQMLGLTRRDDFPEPVANLKVLVWHRADIVRWSKEHNSN